MNIICRDLEDFKKLYDRKIIQSAMLLGDSFSSTDFVMDSYKNIINEIDISCMTIKSFPKNELLEINKLHNKFSQNLSFTDCSILLLAINSGGYVLSNENIIARICAMYQIVTYTTENYSLNIKLKKTG
ncbi:MAG: hypothetical protein PSX81_03730 [bacterium]|nr:hypothetical protein [bacterium]